MSMLLVSTDEVPGYRIVQVFGLVKGNTVRARNIGTDIVAGFRSIVGGEVVEYTKMLAQSREQALDRLKSEAFLLGPQGRGREHGGAPSRQIHTARRSRARPWDSRGSG